MHIMTSCYYYILLSILLVAACQGTNKAKNTGDTAVSSTTEEARGTGPKYVKSVQFVYPMKGDTCQFNQELKIVYANNKRYKIDSAHLFFNQKKIATLDSTTKEYIFKLPKEKCGTNTLKVIAFHPNSKQGVATQSFIVKPDKAPKRLNYKLVKTYNHATDASTQGLAYIDGIMYEGTGIKGQSTLRKIDLESNKTLASLSLDARYFGEGITVYKDKIYQLTWTSKKAFVYDLATFTLLTTFDYSMQEGWGLTTMGDKLVMSDGTHRLYHLDPELFTVIKTVEVYDSKGPVTNLNELEYINGFIWANEWLTDRIVIIDPETGEVTEELLLPNMLTPAEKAKLDENDDVLNGIAYNEKKGTIYVTGKHWPKLFEIKTY